MEAQHLGLLNPNTPFEKIFPESVVPLTSPFPEREDLGEDFLFYYVIDSSILTKTQQEQLINLLKKKGASEEIAKSQLEDPGVGIKAIYFKWTGTYDVNLLKDLTLDVDDLVGA